MEKPVTENSVKQPASQQKEEIQKKEETKPDITDTAMENGKDIKEAVVTVAAAIIIAIITVIIIITLIILSVLPWWKG